MLSASSLQLLGDANMELSFHNVQRCLIFAANQIIYFAAYLAIRVVAQSSGMSKNKFEVASLCQTMLILLFEEVLASANLVWF